MALPAQVQAALDAADATLSAVNSAPDQEGGVSDVATPPDAFQEAPTQEVVTPVAPPSAPPDPFEAKYKVLQGKYNAEVPELHRKVHVLETNLQQAIQRLDDASKAKEAAPEQRPLASPQDVDNFGQDLVDMVSRVSSQAIGRMTQMFDAKFSHIEAKLEGMGQTLQGATQQVAVSAEQAFFDRVTKLVPNWEETNTQPAFLAWLNEVDPVYGVERHVALKRAQSTLNADHAAAVFKAFLGPQPQVKKPDPLDSQVSPRGAATVAPTPVEKQVLTSAQITKFYDDVRRGNYRGNDAEVARIELVINTALAEGRVR